jgi:hypothetical protein
MPPFNLPEIVGQAVQNYQAGQSRSLQRSQLDELMRQHDAEQAYRNRALDVSEAQHFINPSEAAGYLPEDVQKYIPPAVRQSTRIPAELWKGIFGTATSRADMARQEQQATEAGGAIRDAYTTTSLAPGTTLERPAASPAPSDLAPASAVPTEKTVDPKMALLAKILPFLVKNKDISGEVMGATLPKPITLKPGETSIAPGPGDDTTRHVPQIDESVMGFLNRNGLGGGSSGAPGTTRSTVTIAPGGTTITQHPPSETLQGLRDFILSRGYPEGSPEYKQAFITGAQKLQMVPEGAQGFSMADIIKPYQRPGAVAAPGAPPAAAPPRVRMPDATVPISAQGGRFRDQAAAESDSVRKQALLDSAAAADKAAAALPGAPAATPTVQGRPKPPDAATAKEARGFDSILSSLDQVDRAINDPEVAKFRGEGGLGEQSVARGKAFLEDRLKIPTLDPKVRDARAQLQSAMAEYRKALYGVRVTQAETQIINRAVATDIDDPALPSMVTNLRRIAENHRAEIDAQVAASNRSALPPRTGAPAAATAPTGKVDAVRISDGQPGKITPNPDGSLPPGYRIP